METKPGKKGISLTCEQYQKLKVNVINIYYFCLLLKSLKNYPRNKLVSINIYLDHFINHLFIIFSLLYEFLIFLFQILKDILTLLFISVFEIIIQIFLVYNR